MDPRQHLGRRAAIAAAAAVASFGLLSSTPAAAQQPAGLGVSASVTGCSGGAQAGGIICDVAVTFGTVPGAISYTAEVTRPDGSRQSLGAVGPGSASLPVAYTGNGTYVVTISAWGDPARTGDDRPLERDRSE